jgi:formamidase
MYTANVCMAGTDGVFNSMGEGMIVNYDGVPLATGNGAPDEIITAEVRPKLADEARRIWGVENNIYQFGHRGYVAVNSSNRTSRFPASGSRTRLHAFAFACNAICSF